MKPRRALNLNEETGPSHPYHTKSKGDATEYPSNHMFDKVTLVKVRKKFTRRTTLENIYHINDQAALVLIRGPVTYHPS